MFEMGNRSAPPPTSTTGGEKRHHRAPCRSLRRSHDARDAESAQEVDGSESSTGARAGVVENDRTASGRRCYDRCTGLVRTQRRGRSGAPAEPDAAATRHQRCRGATRKSFLSVVT